MTARQPSREERRLWRSAIRDVAPLAPTATPPPTEEGRRATDRAVERPPPPSAVFRPLSPASAPGLDRRSAERLRRGQLAIEARLDLHGMTQDEAHAALDDFLARAQGAGKRCVLVITGKGARGGAPGVLRAAVPRWLNEPAARGRLLAFAPAQPKHGGGGALYLLLRRQR